MKFVAIAVLSAALVGCLASAALSAENAPKKHRCDTEAGGCALAAHRSYGVHAVAAKSAAHRDCDCTDGDVDNTRQTRLRVYAPWPVYPVARRSPILVPVRVVTVTSTVLAVVATSRTTVTTYALPIQP